MRVSPPDHLLAKITDSTLASCAGSCDAQATVTVFGGTPPYSYQWGTESGNQTTATATGLCERPYSVVVTDAVGTTAITQVNIEADPALFNYTGETTLTADADWNGVNYKINDTIFVPADITLSINNSTIEFGIYGKIWVYAGGKLLVDRSKLTNLSNCDNVWGGIVMEGEHNIAQPDTDPMATGYPHAFTWIKDNSTVEYAHTGIYVGNPWYRDTRYGSGGVLWVESGSEIKNCYSGVEFKGYGFTNRSHFKDCFMTCDQAIPSPGYNGAGTNNFIQSWGLIGIQLDNVTFTSSGSFPFNYNGMGFNSLIATEKAVFNNCTFNGLSSGLKGVFYSCKISACSFTDMSQ